MKQAQKSSKSIHIFGVTYGGITTGMIGSATKQEPRNLCLSDESDDKPLIFRELTSNDALASDIIDLRGVYCHSVFMSDATDDVFPYLQFLRGYFTLQFTPTAGDRFIEFLLYVGLGFTNFHRFSLVHFDDVAFLEQGRRSSWMAQRCTGARNGCTEDSIVSNGDEIRKPDIRIAYVI